jgi:hypothetical protein
MEMEKEYLIRAFLLNNDLDACSNLVVIGNMDDIVCGNLLDWKVDE